MSVRPASVALVDDEHRKKRVRKGTKSCWECKRRKVKCQLSSENVSICSGCLSRGTTCISQEYPEEHDSSGGPQIGERLGRIELVLEKLMTKMEQYEEEDNATKIHTPESMGTGDLLTPFANNTSNRYESATTVPILSLFDNPVVSNPIFQSIMKYPLTSNSWVAEKMKANLRSTLLNLNQPGRNHLSNVDHRQRSKESKMR